ncbi:MAG TPA: hypothetical protein VFL30_10915 [Rhodanobacteraceae bacterium]|nr:hypothetical protein [Rhodanobacteraceae bacterium]
MIARRLPDSARARFVALAALLLALQLPLILNPGYFSHDELQWWARADVPSWADLPWIPWLDLSPLQYRPLTFNLWLVLAHAFAATPTLMHLVFVALGTANAWLLARVLADAHVPLRACYAAALVFALSPCAVYVHGWTGTLADLLTLAFLLIGARFVQRGTTAGAIGAALCVAAALLSKESAIVLPALLAFAAYGQRSSRTVRVAVALSAAVVVAYLALRLPILVDSASASPAYAWSPANIAPRTAEYLLYPFTPPLFEIASLLKASIARLAAAAACVALLLHALATSNWRWPVAWLAAFIAALAPVLVLPIAYDQYAYLATALGVAIAAAAWPNLRRAPRAIVAILAAILVAHGAAVMWRMVAAGIVERNLHADLLEIVQRDPSTPIRVAAADPRDAWLVQRLLHEVDRYRGISLLNVRAAESGESAPGARRLRMNRDGHLAAIPSP